MRLTTVHDTREGIRQIGCRAKGQYRGFHIERTAWMPVISLSVSGAADLLHRYAEGLYREEMHNIDNQLDNPANTPNP